MGVYIPGMEMPKSCANCPIVQRTKTSHRCPLASKAHGFSCTVSFGAIEIPWYCPLVPVPPHGRLIDADAVAKMVLESVNQDDAQGFMFTKIICQIMKDAPTIIPAEEGEM